MFYSVVDEDEFYEYIQYFSSVSINKLEKLEFYINELNEGRLTRRQLLYKINGCERLIEQLEKKTLFLNDYENISVAERLYYVLNDLHQPAKCKICGRKPTWYRTKYRPTCSSRDCINKNFSEISTGRTLISENRIAAFIEKQSKIKEVNDEVILDLYEYDTLLDSTTNIFILNYLDNRFKDSSSRLETLQRIRKGIEEKPKCICGNPVNWAFRNKNMFTTYCSTTCANGNENTIEKRHETMLKNWGTRNCYDSPKYRQYLKDTIGVEYHFQRQDLKDKANETKIDHYGTTNITALPEIQEKVKATCRKRYGCDNPMQNAECKEKQFKSSKNSHSYRTSKEEDVWFNKLSAIYPNLERFVKDKEKYPYNCDFYLAEKDLFIEYQGSQYHHGHAFDPTSEDDIAELKLLEEIVKDESSNKWRYAKGTIHVWTQKDPEKRQYCKEHNTNLLEIWRSDKLEDIVEKIELFQTL